MKVNYNQTIPFPADSYRLRCIDESFNNSKNGNPMITLEFEIISPEDCEVGDDIINVAGVKIKNYYITQNFNGDEIDMEKTENSKSRLEALYKVFNIDFSDFNPENPVLGFKGRTVWAHVYNRAQERRKSPTAQQLRERKPGDLIMNPITKKALISNQPAIGEIFGIAED